MTITIVGTEAPITRFHCTIGTTSVACGHKLKGINHNSGIAQSVQQSQYMVHVSSSVSRFTGTSTTNIYPLVVTDAVHTAKRYVLTTKDSLYNSPALLSADGFDFFHNYCTIQQQLWYLQAGSSSSRAPAAAQRAQQQQATRPTSQYLSLVRPY